MSYTKSFGHFSGRLFGSITTTICHPISFAPRFIGHVTKDFLTGIKEGFTSVKPPKIEVTLEKVPDTINAEA